LGVGLGELGRWIGGGEGEPVREGGREG
jgi:hypothetical protein